MDWGGAWSSAKVDAAMGYLKARLMGPISQVLYADTTFTKPFVPVGAAVKPGSEAQISPLEKAATKRVLGDVPISPLEEAANKRVLELRERGESDSLITDDKARAILSRSPD
jgi:hypothetical protein